jgi:hypothetical protein
MLAKIMKLKSTKLKLNLFAYAQKRKVKTKLPLPDSRPFQNITFSFMELNYLPEEM